MADISQTPANVLAVSGATLIYGTAGETITAGMPVYKHTDGKYYKALNDSAAHAAAVGIALNGASASQPLTICVEGSINLGGTLVVGESYFVSNTAGSVAPSADIGTGEFVTSLGVASTASNLKLKINPSGIAHA